MVCRRRARRDLEGIVGLSQTCEKGSRGYSWSVADVRKPICRVMNDPSLSQTITHFLDLMRLMSAYSHDPRFEAEALKLPPAKERNMLAVLTKLEDQGRIEGEKKGRKEGFTTLNRVYENLLNHGRQDDLIRAIQDPEYQKQIMAEFGLAEDGTHFTDTTA